MRVDCAAARSLRTSGPLLGQERFRATGHGRMGALTERIFGYLNRNDFNPTELYSLPDGQVVEVGARIDL